MIEPTLVEFEPLREAVNAARHEGKRKWRGELADPPHLHYERNRYIYDLYYRQEKLSRQLYEFLVREKVVDGALISKWRKPGYEILCSMSAIQKGNTALARRRSAACRHAARRADPRRAPARAASAASPATGSTAGPCGGPTGVHGRGRPRRSRTASSSGAPRSRSTPTSRRA